MDFQKARENMVKQQLRTAGIKDDAILQLMATLPREKFLAPEFQKVAYTDIAIPLTGGEAALAPKETALMLEALAIKKADKILLVGIESGYIAALLAKLGKQVYAVDTNQYLVEQAKLKLEELGITNVNCSIGDAGAGWNESAPYQAIVITGSLPFLPQGFRNNLVPSGRIFAIIGNSPVMEATLVKNNARDQWTLVKLFETDHPRLPNARESDKFKF